MKISKERQDARVRISQLEYRFEMAMEEGDDYLEIEIAMLNVLTRIKNRELVEAYPNPEEGDIPKADPKWTPPGSDLSRFSNINELGQPRCGLWSDLMGPCIRDWPHTHDE